MKLLPFDGDELPFQSIIIPSLLRLGLYQRLVDWTTHDNKSHHRAMMTQSSNLTVCLSVIGEIRALPSDDDGPPFQSMLGLY